MKITRETLQQIIKEEVAKEIEEALSEYSPQMETLFDALDKVVRDLGGTQALADDLLGLRARHGGMKPHGGEPVGDIDMSNYDI